VLVVNVARFNLAEFMLESGVNIWTLNAKKKVK
jgi:hypothetical protein